MCYTWGERVILVLWLDSWFLGRSWWWDPLNCQNQDRVSGYWVILRKCVLYIAMAKHFGVAVRWARWLSDTDDDDKVCLSQNWWWPLMSFFVLLCHLLPPGCRPTPGASKQTLHWSPQVWSTQTAFYSTSESKAVGTFSIFQPSEENLALSGTATVKPVNEWMEFRQKGRTASQLCPTRSLALCVHKFKIANSSDLIWNQVVQKQEVKELGRKLLAFPVDQIDQSEFICEERGKGRICILWISDQSSQTYL